MHDPPKYLGRVTRQAESARGLPASRSTPITTMKVLLGLLSVLLVTTTAASVITRLPVDDPSASLKFLRVEGQGAEIQLGQDGELSCTAHTTHQPTSVSWERVAADTGESVPLRTDDKEKTEEGRKWSWTLKFYAVTAGDDGLYRCTIKTLNGEKASVDVRLEVTLAPIVHTYEDATTITCAATSLPESRVWLDGVTSPQTISTILNADGTWTSTATVTFEHLEQPIGSVVTCMVKYRGQVSSHPFKRPDGHADGRPLDPDYFIQGDD